MALPSAWLAVAVVPFALSPPPGWPAQTPSQPVRFVAASVRPNTDGAPGQSMRRLPGGRFTAVNVSAHSLLLMAFSEFQIAGGPSWIRTDRFDIVAKLEGERSVGAPVAGLTVSALARANFICTSCPALAGLARSA